MRIIGFCGRAGAGKTTAAEVLVRDGFVCVPFAAPLKKMTKALLRYQGVDDVAIRAMVDGPLKTSPSVFLGSRTPRHAMQTLGTEWAREHLHREFWVRAWQNHVASKGLKRVVVDDVRFPNEVEAIRALAGVVVKIDGREDPNTSAAHASEAQIDDFDILIHNGGSIGDLVAQVERMLLPRL
jgi:hypothetical protein